MNTLIIDAANNKIFLMIIKSRNIYSVSYENSKTNYEKLIILVNNFLKSYDLKIDDLSKLYVNRGPGSFAGIRNSLALVKGIHAAKKIDYYCFSFDDFGDFHEFGRKSVLTALTWSEKRQEFKTNDENTQNT